MVIIMNNIEYLNNEMDNIRGEYSKTRRHFNMLLRCHQSKAIVEEIVEVKKMMGSLSLAMNLTGQLLLDAGAKERGAA